MQKKYLLPVISLVLSLVFVAILAFPALADTFSQSYTATTAIPVGSLVALQQGSSSQIVPADSSNTDSLLGVTVASQASLVNLNSNNGNTLVVTSGNATVLVSNINGDVAKGDSLTTSPITGVAMKATAPGKIIGIATENFGSSQATSRQKIVNKKGESTEVALGQVSVNITVGNYQNQPTLTGNGVISAVQAVATSTTGKSISTARALFALLVLLIAVVISVLILYTAVASSIRSIGRNPLSRHSILQSLIQVIIAVVVIMLSGFSIVYLIIGR